MYKVTIINGGEETEIHNPNVNNLKLEQGSIRKEINMIDSFNMSFFQNNPAYGRLNPLKTIVKVQNTKTGLYEFEGRVLGLRNQMTTDGLVTYTYKCEGELAYFHDSQQHHDEFRGTPLELFSQILNYHNGQVEEYKRFEVGVVDVTNSTDNLYIYLSAEEDTFEAIEGKLIERIGGELHVRKENGVRYLDLLERVGDDKQTEIKLAKNLRSMSQDVDPTEIITRLTPLGTRIESDDEDATDASQARLTIESVNDGVPYLDDEALIEVFGIKGGSVTWDDVNEVSNLLSRGVNWLANQKVSLNQYEISALDLFLIGLDIDYFDVGNSHPVNNPIMGMDERLRIIGKTTNINSPEDASLKIGDKFKTLNDYQRDANRSARKVVDLEQMVNRQAQTISNLKTDVTQQIENVKDMVDNIDVEDIPALQDAIESLNSAVNNLTDVVDDIPIYELATSEEDGLMSAGDKAKINHINVSNNVNLNQVNSKVGLITVTQQIDLDQLYADVEALKNENKD
ncbi:phage tail protein [Salipaludibacillus sp. LMS25]|jgi:hypothetical protein|uniref:phage tail spike protein n=1 Tax=Salipaludibacillus sp. LMS25 TaxID=2924031 RepID=UPI0020D11242|nr:phage tail spike protein [Salipaludibacillus sp. LMS25]UTR15517.1 phage tail protein [Salipaludibacillus sp. LMS25]